MNALLVFVRSHTGLTVAAAMAAFAVLMVLSVMLETLLSNPPGERKAAD